jgi:hypothetical protein
MTLAGGYSIAQPPYELPKQATETELQEVVVPLSDAVKRKISEALSRDAQSNEPSGSTGDPILDDVLNVIRRQGSVLDGSSLDPQLPPAKTGSPLGSRNAENDSPIFSGDPVPAYPIDDEQSLSGPDARFHVAESLLRAARELAALPGRDQQRNRLIAAMREQATVLMIDEFSQIPNDSK